MRSFLSEDQLRENLKRQGYKKHNFVIIERGVTEVSVYAKYPEEAENIVRAIGLIDDVLSIAVSLLPV